MVTAHYLIIDHGVVYVVLKVFGNHEVVNSPANVLASGAAHVAPPGIDVFLLWVEITVAVNEAGL